MEMGKHTNLKIDDFVVVKPDTKDPDLDMDIGGWQGRISEVDLENNLVCIDWNSSTLKNISAWVIERCEHEGLEWHRMYLEIADVETVVSTDTKKDVGQTKDLLENRYVWVTLGDEGKKIQEFLSGIDLDNELEVYEAWAAHLDAGLQFPFKAEVSETQERGSLQVGDRVTVHRIVEVDERFGILVDIRHGQRKFIFPLCDLEATDRKSADYALLRPYVVWFANQ